MIFCFRSSCKNNVRLFSICVSFASLSARKPRKPETLRMGWTCFFAPLFVFVSSGFAPSGAPLLVSCSFCFGALGGNGCGSPVLGLAFRSLVPLGSGLSWLWCALARAVLVPFPCMGGSPFSWCLVCAPLVSFVVWLVFRFKPGICAFAFRLWCSPLARGLSFGLRPTLPPSGYGLRPSPELNCRSPFGRPIKIFFP